MKAGYVPTLLVSGLRGDNNETFCLLPRGLGVRVWGDWLWIGAWRLGDVRVSDLQI